MAAATTPVAVLPLVAATTPPINHRLLTRIRYPRASRIAMISSAPVGGAHEHPRAAYPPECAEIGFSEVAPTLATLHTYLRPLRNAAGLPLASLFTERG